MPAVAIVIPAHNRATLLPRTLASVLAQTRRPDRVVLVDNGSTDRTPAVMRDWAAARIAEGWTVEVLTEAKPGAAAARNAGLRAVQEEWTMFFDSDDEMAPTHLALAMKCAEETPKADLIGWDVTLLLPGKRPMRKPFERFDMLFHCILDGCMATQRYMARTALFRQAGGWDESAMVWNDIELGTRLLTCKKDLMAYKLTNPPTVTVHFTEQSITGTSFSASGTEREHAIDLIEADLPPESRWMARLKRAILAGCYAREGQAEMANALATREKEEPSRFRRIGYAFARRYTAMGGRGAARIFRNFF
ncbi:MAG: glycosyltransferase family 2 protein [Muribaculaceae bacterium]|nr:glycosyltransferase family 2 protein [Muribaculaceae bacterium]